MPADSGERPENAILVLTKDYEALEFVMLERVLSRSQSRRAALKQAIRPIPLAVNRLYPDPIRAACAEALHVHGRRCRVPVGEAALRLYAGAMERGILQQPRPVLRLLPAGTPDRPEDYTSVG